MAGIADCFPEFSMDKPRRDRYSIKKRLLSASQPDKNTDIIFLNFQRKKVMSGTFIDSLPQDEKIWSAKAIAGMIIADGIVTPAEIQILRESISFLDDVKLVNDIVNNIKARKKPELEILKTDRVMATNILMDLGLVALADSTLSAEEIQYFVLIAQKLGFDLQFAKKVIAWSRDYSALKVRRSAIAEEGAFSKPMYVGI